MAKNERVSPGFDLFLTVMNLVVFAGLALNAFTGFSLSPWTATVFMILAGAGLMLEGKILTAQNWLKDGIQRPEIAYVFTIVFGIFTIVIGILAMPGVDILTNQTNAMIGWVSLMCIVFISLQKWVIN